MTAEMGEYAVGAYLRVVIGCDVIDYNVRRIEGGMEGLDEIDVIGLHFEEKTAYLCEVTTHIRGLNYGSNEETVERVKRKYRKLREYAKIYLSDFPTQHYMFWSPIVPVGYITENLKKIRGLELILNEEYTARINELREEAKIMSNDAVNPFFRVLQILERLRGRIK